MITATWRYTRWLRHTGRLKEPRQLRPTIRSTGHFAASRSRPSFHSWPCAPCRKTPVSSNVRPHHPLPLAFIKLSNTHLLDMGKLEAISAALSLIALGAFWPTLKVNFEASFARMFILPAFLVAIADCFFLSYSIGWWTILSYPILLFVGSAVIGMYTTGKHLKTIVIDGGIWIIGLSAVLLTISAVVIWMYRTS